MQNSRRHAFHILTILVFVVLSYANTFNAPFQLDDISNIVFNPAIRSFDCFMDTGMLDSPPYADTFDKPLFRTRYFGYLTFAVNHAIHGLDVRGYHLTNLLIHVGSALLVYLLVVLTFRTPRFSQDNGQHPIAGPSRDYIAFFSALLFAVHPVQTQAVTYLVQRFASLASMLCLLSLVCYIQFRLSAGCAGRFKRPALYALSLLSAVLAMKTKEFALLIPILMVLYEGMFLDGSLRRRLMHVTPFFLTVIIVLLSLSNTLGSGLDSGAAKISGAQGSIGRLDYLFTQFRVVVTYFRLLLFPVNQRFDYDYPIYRSFFTPEVAISALLLLLILLGGVYLWRLSCDPGRRNRQVYRLIAFGIFWFFIAISAESSIIPIFDVIFEHRLYLPSIGFFIALVSAVELLRVEWGERITLLSRMAVFFLLVLAAAFSTATYARNALWGDRVAFLENEVKLSPAKDRTRMLLGIMYGELGRMDEAVQQFKTAIASNPGYGGSHYNLAITYKRMGLLEEAASEYRQTIAIKFDYADAHASLGEIYLMQGRLEDAVREYAIVAMLLPQSAQAHYNLGIAYRKSGQHVEALRQFRTAVAIKPDFVEAQRELGAYPRQ